MQAAEPRGGCHIHLEGTTPGVLGVVQRQYYGAAEWNEYGPRRQNRELRANAFPDRQSREINHAAFHAGA